MSVNKGPVKTQILGVKFIGHKGVKIQKVEWELDPVHGVPGQTVIGSENAVGQIGVFGIDIGKNMVHIVVLPAPALFVDRGFPAKVFGVKLGNLGKIIVLPMQYIVANFNAFEIAVQK